MWQTYTPDGLILTIRRQPDGWLATCMHLRVEAATPEEAIRGALAVGNPSGNEKLEEWIAEHVGALEKEVAAEPE